MATHQPQFIVDDRGSRTAVILDIQEYEQLIDEAEALEAIRAYDVAKQGDDEVIPFEQAISEIERRPQ